EVQPGRRVESRRARRGTGPPVAQARHLPVGAGRPRYRAVVFASLFAEELGQRHAIAELFGPVEGPLREIDEVLKPPHGLKGRVRALTPPRGAERELLDVEADPGSHHEIRVDEHEPAVRRVLCRTGLAGELAPGTELAANPCAGAPVDNAPHHVED